MSTPPSQVYGDKNLCCSLSGASPSVGAAALWGGDQGRLRVRILHQRPGKPRCHRQRCLQTVTGRSCVHWPLSMINTLWFPVFFHPPLYEVKSWCKYKIHVSEFQRKLYITAGFWPDIPSCCWWFNRSRLLTQDLSQHLDFLTHQGWTIELHHAL